MLIWFTNCQRHGNNKPYKSTTINYESSNNKFIPTDSNQFYFPIEAFNDNSMFVGQDTFIVNWYSKQLYAMREPLIFGDRSQGEIYRFTWLRTFHNPVAIRIENQGDNYMIYWKLCNGAGGYEPGKLIIDKQKSLDKQTWEKFIDLLHDIKFWNMDTQIKTLGLDGSQWILEGKDLNHYHVVDRWSPDVSSKFFKCCDFLIGQTDIHITGGDKY